MRTVTPTATDPVAHTRKIRHMLIDVVEQARGELARIDEPRAQAMLETTAEALIGLTHAFEDYERGIEAVWKR